jgi:hypothetical protein
MRASMLTEHLVTRYTDALGADVACFDATRGWDAQRRNDARPQQGEEGLGSFALSGPRGIKVTASGCVQGSAGSESVWGKLL